MVEVLQIELGPNAVCSWGGLSPPLWGWDHQVMRGVGRGDNTFVEEDVACKNQCTLYQMPVLWFVGSFTRFNSSIALTFGW